MACDFFHVGTVLIKRLYVLLFIHHDTRRVRIAGVIAIPDADWVTQQARNLSMDLARQMRLSSSSAIATRSSPLPSTRLHCRGHQSHQDPHQGTACQRYLRTRRGHYSARAPRPGAHPRSPTPRGRARRVHRASTLAPPPQLSGPACAVRRVTLPRRRSRTSNPPRCKGLNVEGSDPRVSDGHLSWRTALPAPTQYQRVRIGPST